MLPYLIAGAIGFGIGKLFENGGETFMAGGNTSSIIEEGDSVIMYFNQDTELEIFDSEDFELEEPNIDIFKKGIEFEVDIFGVDDIKYDVQFGDGSVAFIRKDNITIVSVNGDEFENGGETFMAGGRINTNEDLLNSFLTSSKEVKVNNLSTHFNEYENLLLLRNYGTIIAGRYVNNNENDYRYGTLNFCYVTKTKYSQTTTKIVNKLKALATKMGYTITDACTFDDGGEMFMAGGNTGLIIEEGDSVIMYFNQDTELEIFDSEDFELEEPNSDIFKKGIEFEVDIFGVDDIKYDVQFGDGSVAFIRKDNITIVSVNGDEFENGGETFMAGGMTNEDILRSFLTSERETQTNNLATFYSTLGAVMLLRNYGTLIAKRNGRRVEITNVKHSKTTSAITNRLKALAEEMGYNVSYVSEFEEGGGVEYRIGGEVDKELTIEQTRKIAQETANSLGTEFSVTKNTVDVASFDLDLNGEEFEGGSYLIMKNGDVLNVALPNNPVYYNYKERSKNPKMVRTIFEEEYFENFDNGGWKAGTTTKFKTKKEALKSLELLKYHNESSTDRVLGL
jgi:ribosome maturation factor RimP